MFKSKYVIRFGLKRVLFNKEILKYIYSSKIKHLCQSNEYPPCECIFVILLVLCMLYTNSSCILYLNVVKVQARYSAL